MEAAAHVGQDDDRKENEAGKVQPGQTRGVVEPLVQDHTIDDEPHEQRLDHLQTGDHQGDEEHRAELVAVRPEPVDVLAQVSAAGARGGGRRWPFPGAAAVFVGDGVQPPVLIVLDELLVSLARRTSGAHETT